MGGSPSVLWYLWSSSLTCSQLGWITPFCSLQGLMTACFTAIRLIWNYFTFLEKMSQDYREERWKRFIKLVSPSSCQSVAVPGRAHSSSAPAMFFKCLVMCCQPLSLTMFTASTFPGQEHSEPLLLCSALLPDHPSSS